MDKQKQKERALNNKLFEEKKSKYARLFYIKIGGVLFLLSIIFSIFSNPDMPSHFDTIFPPLMNKNITVGNIQDLSAQLEYHNCFIFSYTTLTYNNQKATYGYCGKVYFFSDFNIFSNAKMP